MVKNAPKDLFHRGAAALQHKLAFDYDLNISLPKPLAIYQCLKSGEDLWSQVRVRVKFRGNKNENRSGDCKLY